MEEHYYIVVPDSFNDGSFFPLSVGFNEEEYIIEFDSSKSALDYYSWCKHNHLIEESSSPETLIRCRRWDGKYINCEYFRPIEYKEGIAWILTA